MAMAEGALHCSPANVAVAITGVAGPNPDDDGNPVGLVCIAVARDGCGPSHVERKYGELGREKVQEHAMADALAELIPLPGRGLNPSKPRQAHLKGVPLILVELEVTCPARGASR
jgi:hypothetical protein